MPVGVLGPSYGRTKAVKGHPPGCGGAEVMQACWAPHLIRAGTFSGQAVALWLLGLMVIWMKR